jgi:hypothetical protein
LPVEYVGRRRNVFWESLRDCKLFILKVILDEIGAPIPLIKLGKGKLCWSNGSADKFLDLTFVEWNQK